MSYSTIQAARKLGISIAAMHRYMRARIFPVPRMQAFMGVRVRVWSEADIRKARKLMPKLKNGRKTRHQKSQKKQKTQARAPVVHKKRKKKK
jgi:predicted DNA-binding transcriptional regulator AlpA